MLEVTAIEPRDPMVLFILVVAHNRLLHAFRLGKPHEPTDCELKLGPFVERAGRPQPQLAGTRESFSRRSRPDRTR